MTSDAPATQPRSQLNELGSLAGHYSTADGALPWWGSALVFSAGILTWVVFGTDGWVYYLGYMLFLGGIFGLTLRALQATTEITPAGLSLKSVCGRRTHVTWSEVVDVLPPRFSSGRSKVRLADGQRVLLGGIPATKARRLREVLHGCTTHTVPEQ